MKNVKIVILAAGKGKRMGADIPKVLVPLNGKPIIKYLLDAVVKSGVDSTPIVVVSPDNKSIIEEELAKYSIKYAVQKEQLGTAHAVKCGLAEIDSRIEKIIIINGDHPFIKDETIGSLAEDSSTIAMLVAEVPDFKEWRQNFYHWGRIKKDNKGEIIEIKEFKDADEIEKEIKDVNPAVYAFNYKWLKENIEKINNNNAQKEYYLTDLIKLAFLDKITIRLFPIDAKEAMGINSKEELEIAEKLVRQN